MIFNYSINFLFSVIILCLITCITTLYLIMCFYNVFHSQNKSNDKFKNVEFYKIINN